MKKIFLLLIYLLTTTIVFAQRYSTSSNINISLGALTTNKGFNATIGYEKLLNNNKSIGVDLNFLNQEQDVKNVSQKAKLNFYQADIIYKIYLPLKDNLFPFVGIGGFGGYKTFNNEKDFSNNLKLDIDDSFIYGLMSSIGIEYNIQNISCVIFTNPQYEFHDKKFKLPINIGFKYFY